jgi:diguanylate cyclase (GGDEF)-like protein
MSTLVLVNSPGDDAGDNSNNFSLERRVAALSAAAVLWPTSKDLFRDDFMADADVLDGEKDELGDLLTKVEAFSHSSECKDEELFKFRELLVAAAHSVFLRWRVLNQLRSMALTDDLTGLYNRRGFLLLGTHHLRLAFRTSNPMFLFFADVDGLKTVNDCCGHIQGDALLVACAEVLKMTFRESDIVARIGGDEFAILAQANSNNSEEIVLQRLKSAIDRMNSDVLAPYQLSLSIGVASFDTSNPMSLCELLSIADREMLHNKASRYNFRSS